MKKYNIGLDIGTTSVGWAVVESNTQKIMRKGNEKLWGVRLFEEAQPASGRRGFRGSRRRYDRRRMRIQLLQDLFKDEIEKIDEDFYQKLKESFYHEADVENKTIILTKQERESVRQYYKQYPTIYHLRNKLIFSKEKMDIRLVYSAVHHLLKYRGNFLYAGDHFNVNDLNLKEKLETIFGNISDLCPELEFFDDDQSAIDFESLSQVLLEPSKNDRKLLVQDLLSPVLPKNFVNEFNKMICGNKFNIIKLLSLELENEKVEMNFSGSEYEEKYSEYEELLGDKIEVLDQLKQLFDVLFLKRLFKGSNHTVLSSLMVDKYEIHKKDLKFLKELLSYDRKIYHIFFRTKQNMCLYEKYVRNQITNEEFVRELQKYLPALFELEISSSLSTQYMTEIKDRIANGEFLPRITDSENGKYPYQLNKEELIKIIENQGQYYPFLLDKVDDKTYKLVRLLEFKIPYYVGPLTSEKNSPFAWMVRKQENVKITPYNFDEVIDKEQTAEKFIKRMISHCTYLLAEPAMPNQSILYSKYKVFNELKQICVNDYRLTKELQHKIFSELFLKTSGTITDEKFKNYLYHCGDFDMYGEDIRVTGYSADKKFANHMQSYIDFFGENGIFSEMNYSEEDAENIIEWITIFEDKEILENKIRSSYPQLTEAQINKALQKKYKGWSSLSRKLLTEKYYLDPEDGVARSILDLMYETDENFMQIINNEKYHFQKMIAENNHVDAQKKTNYSLVEDLATSPATKRGIYQALKLVEEIVDYIGYSPEAITLEMARGDEKKVRKDDRKKYLLKLYESSKETIEGYHYLLDQLNKYERIDTQKLFLYFIQEGKSLYSGKPLNIEDLDSYEIDHIIPRTLIKDDSIDNKALVYREENQIKAASYVLPREYRSERNRTWWEHLKRIGLLSRKKFNSLIRSQYKAEDIEGFINRQLVETRQITKHVANILSNYYEDSKVIYLKANLSHSYRERYDLFKFREINNYHHAHDAYLAAVLGEYKEKFLKRKVDFDLLKELNHQLLASGDYQRLRYGYVINSLDGSMQSILKNLETNLVNEKTGEVFDAEEFHQHVENTLYQNDIMISKKTEIRTGEFYNQTKNKKGLNGVPLKSNLSTELYGSYTRLNPAYAVLVKYTSKNKTLQKLVGLPIYILEKSKTDLQVMDDYLRKLLKLSKTSSLEIISKPIPFFSLLDWNGQVCYLVGASDTVEVCNAKEFHFDRSAMEKFKYCLNKLFNQKKAEVEGYEDTLIEIIQYIVEKMENEYKLYQNLLPELKSMIHYDQLHTLSLEEREKTIIELFKLLKCDSKNANFKFLNTKYSSAFGKKNSRVIDHAQVKCKSVTGIRKHQYEF